jgi:hypothetical protein
VAIHNLSIKLQVHQPCTIGFDYGSLQKSQSIEALNSIDIGYDLDIGN